MVQNENEEHWIKFIKNAEETNPGELHICIHPSDLDIRESILNKWQQHFENKDNFMVCDKDYWVATGWGNISLSFATLMAIQYALSKHEFDNKYYRKIIFLQQGAPLYRFQVINEILNENNKSWFKPRDGQYPERQYQLPYNFNREPNNSIEKQSDIGDWNWFSAIFALDVNHIKIFFNDKERTWIKDGIYRCRNIPFDNIKTNDETKQNFITQVVGKWGVKNDDILNRSCVNSDETFFGVAFKSYFDGNDINEHINFIDEPIFNSKVTNLYFNDIEDKKIHYLYDTDDKLNPIKTYSDNFGETNIPNNFFDDKFSSIEYKPEDLKKNHLIYLPRVIWWRTSAYISNSNDLPIYKGVRTDFNPNKLEEFYIIRDDKLVNKEKIKSVTDLISEKDILDGIYNINGEKISKPYKIPSDNNDNYTEKKIFKSLTYHDWSSWSLLPNNLLRNSYIVNSENNKTNIYVHVKEKSTTDFIKFIESAPNFKDIGRMRVTYHPAEYGTTNMRELVNTFNLLTDMESKKYNKTSEKYDKTSKKYDKTSKKPIDLDDIDLNIYFGGNNIYDEYSNPNPNSETSKTQNNDSNWTNDKKNSDWHTQNKYRLFTMALFLYETVIFKFRDWIKVDSNGYIMITNEDIEYVEVGTPLTSDILSSAITHGSLFIRKVINGSRINKYTDTLFKLEKNPIKIKNRKKLEGKEYLFAPNIFGYMYDREKKGYYFDDYKYTEKYITKGGNKNKYFHESKNHQDNYKDTYLKLKKDFLNKKNIYM